MEPRAAAAFFDVDGTIARTNIVESHAYFATRGFGSGRRALWILGSLPRLLGYLVLDRASRRRFNRVFYRSYRGHDAAGLRAQATAHFEAVFRPRIFPGALAAIAEHRAAGRRVVLVTGSLDFIVAPLAAFLGPADVVAAGLVERAGKFTGELAGPPIGEEEKARAVEAFAARHTIDLAASWAYGDSIADLPMLRAVGNPVAVNPDARLRRVARRAGWPIAGWPPARRAS